MQTKWTHALEVFINCLLCLVLLAGSTLMPLDPTEKPRNFTRSLEFDYISWTYDAFWIKQQQSALGIPRYLTAKQQSDAVKQYLALVQSIERTEAEIEKVYADPNILNKDSSVASLSAELVKLKESRKRLGPIAEEILQQQVSTVLVEQNLAVAGQPLPPLLYHVTPLPMALIISPRNQIREENHISLAPDLPLERVVALENQVEKSLNVSALVTEVGGIGTYPTMVMSTTDISWLMEVISHEWTHNFLTLRPLGINYFISSQLRTINETVANIAGKEIGRAVIARFYPEFLPPPPRPTPTPRASPTPTPTPPPNPPPFSFNREMRITRVTVDQLLKENKIEEAEAYMEIRRKFLWDNGYLIRRLNQAYFAFHGAYADDPGGGAAGEDPVGPAVVKLRSQSDSLADFLNRVSWMTSFDEVKKAIQQN